MQVYRGRGAAMFRGRVAGLAPFDKLRMKGRERPSVNGREKLVVCGDGEATVLDGHGRAGAASVVTRDIGGLATFVLSTDDVDRHGDVVSADGWRLEGYLRNPVLLWAHDYRRPAIGRAVAVWGEPRRLLAKVEFAPTAFAQEVAALYEQGFQCGVSVGFRPMRWEERRDLRTGAFLGLRYLEQELLEVSAVPVPANREALRRGVSPPPQPSPSGGGSAISGDRERSGAEAGIAAGTVALGALLAELAGARSEL